MNKLFLLVFMLLTGNVFAASSGLIAHGTSDTNPTIDDLTYVIDNPAVTPSDKKVTLGNLPKAWNMTTTGTNVGVGSTNPGQILDVTGTVRATGLIGAINTLTSGTSLTIGGTAISGLSGNTGSLATTTGILSTSKYLEFDASGNVIAGTVTSGSGTISGLNAGKVPVASNSTTIIDSQITQLGSNVGIGSASPGTVLDVQGSVRATAFVGNGSGLTGISGSISGLTTNKLTKAASSTTIADSTITDNGTNVGIGSGVPGATLDVAGNVQTTTGLSVTGSGAGKTQSANGLWFDGGHASATTNDLYIATTDNVGIGTLTPATKLDVKGTVQMTGFALVTSPTSGYVLTSDSAGRGTWVAATGGSSQWTTAGTGIYYSTGNVGIGTVNPTQSLELVGTSSYVKTKSTDSSNPSGIQMKNSDGAHTVTLAILPSSDPSFPNYASLYNSYNAGFVIGTNDNYTSAFNANGNLGIGTTVAPGKLVVGASPTHNNIVACWTSSGVGYCSGSVSGTGCTCTAL